MADNQWPSDRPLYYTAKADGEFAAREVSSEDAKLGAAVYLTTSRDAAMKSMRKGGHVYQVDTSKLTGALYGNQVNFTEQELTNVVQSVLIQERADGSVALLEANELYGDDLGTDANTIAKNLMEGAASDTEIVKELQQSAGGDAKSVEYVAHALNRAGRVWSGTVTDKAIEVAVYDPKNLSIDEDLTRQVAANREHKKQQGHRRLTDDEIFAARNASLLELADKLGMQMVEDSGVYRWADHDSLVISPKVNLWKWNSRNIGGGPIELVKQFSDADSFPKAVRFILDEDVSQANYQEAERQPYENRIKIADDFSQARQYLVGARGLNGALIDALHKKGYIQQNQYGDVVFQWAKSGKTVGASIQGTTIDYERYGKRGTFKHIAKDSEQNFGFNFSIGQPNRLYIFEAPIDALSYWSTHPDMENAMFAAVDGLKEKSVYEMTDYMLQSKGVSPDAVYLGVDNDHAGRSLVDKMELASYVSADGQAVHFKANVPDDNAISQGVQKKIAAVAEGAGIPWTKLAAAEKVETNFDAQHRHGNGLGFAAKLTAVLDEPFDYEQGLRQSADAIARATTGVKTDWVEYVRTVTDGASLDMLQDVARKLEFYDKQYQMREYRPVRFFVKDWNERLKTETSMPLLKQLQSYKYRYNDKELELAQMPGAEKRSFALRPVNEPNGELFFESNDPQQLVYMMRHYGVKAIDVQDRQQAATQEVAVPRLTAPFGSDESRAELKTAKAFWNSVLKTGKEFEVLAVSEKTGKECTVATLTKSARKANLVQLTQYNPDGQPWTHISIEKSDLVTQQGDFNKLLSAMPAGDESASMTVKLGEANSLDLSVTRPQATEQQAQVASPKPAVKVARAHRSMSMGLGRS